MNQQPNQKLRANRAWAYPLVGACLPLLIPGGWYAWRAFVGGSVSEAEFAWFIWAASLMTASMGLLLALFNERRVRTAAERDQLTGLLNQNGFVRTTKLLLELCMRYDEPLSVMMMDLDHFKQVNDKNNHLVGSHVIKEVGKLIAHNMRKSDVCARFGGDEYVVCLPKTGAREARLAAERVRKRLAGETFRYKNAEVKVTVSIGVATIRTSADLGRLLEEADAALYRAKAGGRDRVEDDGYDDDAQPAPKRAKRAG